MARSSSRKREREAREAEGRARRQKGRDNRRAEKRAKRKEDEDRKLDRHAKARARGQEQVRTDQAKRRGKRDEVDASRKSRIAELDKGIADDTGIKFDKKGKDSAGEEVRRFLHLNGEDNLSADLQGKLNALKEKHKNFGSVKSSLAKNDARRRMQAERAKLKVRQKVVGLSRKHATDLLSNPIGKGKDLENQASLRKTAMRLGGSSKKAVELLKRRAKGGADWTGKDKADFDKQWKKEIVKGLPKDIRRNRVTAGTQGEIADKIIGDQPKTLRSGLAEKQARTKKLDSDIPKGAIESSLNALTEKNIPDENGEMRSNFDVLKKEGFSGLSEALKDEVLDEAEKKKIMEDYNLEGDSKINDIVYDEAKDTYTLKITRGGNEVDVPLDRASRKAWEKAQTGDIADSKVTAKTDKIAKAKVKAAEVKAKATKLNDLKVLDAKLTNDKLKANVNDKKNFEANAKDSEKAVVDAQDRLNELNLQRASQDLIKTNADGTASDTVVELDSQIKVAEEALTDARANGKLYKTQGLANNEEELAALKKKRKASTISK
jgi:hypothetical protein